MLHRIVGSTIWKAVGLIAIATGPFFWATAKAELQTAYVWADKPNDASYNANAQYSSQAPTPVVITRRSVGRYSVNLQSFYATGVAGTKLAHGGTVQVSAYGATGNFCQIVSWAQSVEVACFNASGAPADTQFTLLSMKAGSGDPVNYAWAGQPSTPTYTASSSYSWKAGGPVTVTRNAVGSYQVSLDPGIASTQATLVATAYGTAARHCQIGGWFTGNVTVKCYDAAGVASDSAFTILAVKSSAAERRFSFAYANQPNAASYSPLATYSFAPQASGGATIQRMATGRYAVNFGARIHHVQVTAYGNSFARCNPVSWSPSVITIACFNASGAAIDSPFTVLAMNSDAATGLVLGDITPIDPSRPILDGRVPDFTPIPVPGGGTTPPAERLFGFADLHTHPGSFLGFGGRADGRQGMMWGRPAVGDGFRGTSMSARFGQCPIDDHSELAYDFLADPNPDLAVQGELRKLIMSIADGTTEIVHTNRGATGFEQWPSSIVLSHQQIDVEWLRRAHHGGLRAFVAAVVDNEIVDTAYDWTLSDLLPLVRDFLDGRPLRPALGLPRPGFALEQANTQIDFFEQMARENSSFMEVAHSGAEARDIISRGKLAMIIGLELDTLTPEEMDILVETRGVRFITPIHFVDNLIGGSATYKTMFSLLSGIIGSSGNLQALRPDSDLDFFIGRDFGAAQASLNALTRSALGWSPLGTACLPNARTTDGRLGCIGQRNALGLRPGTGEAALRRLIGNGVMIDVAHMSEESMRQTITLAESMQCPVMDSHTGMRAATGFSPGSNERAIPADLALRLLRTGGLIGVGTGGGEFDHPRRLWYNAGNPLMDFREGRSVWTLDLRQPELQQDLVDGAFRQYRITIRIGSDNVESSNTLTAHLLSASGEMGVCPLTTGSGIPGHTVRTITCSLASDQSLAAINGLTLEHTAAHEFSPDNVSIDEVIVEANVIRPTTGWVTVLQRTGGNEGEVIRLKDVRALSAGQITGFQTWTTRLLPRADQLRGNITGLRLRNFTNEDDLRATDEALSYGSAPARLAIGLSGHRENMDVLFGADGLPSGAFVNQRINFPSGGERLMEMIDRAQDVSFPSITLTTGENGADEMITFIADLRAAADAGAISAEDVSGLLAAAAPAIVATSSAAVSWALADPLSAGIAAIIAYVEFNSHDNWSSVNDLSLLITDGSGVEREVPFLVGYNPMQRIKGDEPDSEIFRGLPERIERNRNYGGVVIKYRLTRQDGTSEISGDNLVFEIEFTDGLRFQTAAAPGGVIPIGNEYRAFIPFDRLRQGRELRAFRVQALGGTPYLIRSLDIGLARDPMETFAQNFGEINDLGDFPGQVSIGTDLSGFEALVPFTAISPGTSTPGTDPSCPPGSVASVPCPGPGGVTSPPTPPFAPYTFDVERVAGRADPARRISSLGVPASLGIARVDGTSGRLLDMRKSGVSTIGQLPDFMVAAHNADQVRAGGTGALGPEVFNNVDALVRAWERLDVARASTAADSAVRCSAP